MSDCSPDSEGCTSHQSRPRSTLAVLARIHNNFPELDSLIRILRENECAIDARFVSAYAASTTPSTRKSLLVRAATGDASLDLGPLTEQHVSNMVAWLLANNALEDGDASRETVPKGFAQRVIARRGSVAEVTKVAFVQPWWRITRGESIGVSAYADLDSNTLMPALATVAHARHLRCSHLDRLFSTKSQRLTSRKIDWFFDTGIPELDLRNALVLLASVIDGDRRGGRVQNDIPVAITDRWNLPRLSLPAAIGFCDAVANILGGLIDLTLLTRDPCGLVPVLSDAHSRAFVSGSNNDPDAARALYAHQQRWRPSAAWTARWTASRTRLRAGVFDTGFMLNADRIPYATPALAFLEPYYRAFDTQRWINHLRRSPDPLHHRTADRIDGLYASGLLSKSGVRCRDFGNVIEFLEHAGAADDEQAAYKALPSVGRLTMGEVARAEPSTRSASTPVRSRAYSGLTPPRHGDLPLFAPVMGAPPASLPKAYLLLPGYDSAVPDDRPVFTHRVWRTLQVPSTVTLIGADTLPWSCDPRSDARDALRALGFEVIELRHGGGDQRSEYAGIHH